MDSFPFIPTALAALKRNGLIAAITFASATLGSVLYLVVTPPIYESSTRILLNEGEETISDLGRALTKLDSIGTRADPLATQSELIASESVLGQAVQRLKDGNASLPLTVSDLRKKVRVEIIPATSILEISYSDRDPKTAAAVLNAIAESTAAVNGEAIRQEAYAIRKFLEEQVPKEEIRLAEAEAAENLFRQENGMISLDRQVSALVDSMSKIEDEERQVIEKLQELREKTGLLQQVTGTDAIQSAYDSVRMGQDESLSDLRNKLLELEISISASRSRLGDQHPELQALLEQQVELKQLYQRQLERGHSGSQTPSDQDLASNPLSQDLMSQLIGNQIEYQSLSKRLAALQSNKATLQDRMAQIPALSQPLSALIRQRQSAEEALKKLRASLEEARIAEAQLVSNIRILGKASVPTTPSKPSKPAVLILGMAAGVVLAASSVVLMEALESRLRSTEEAKAFLGFPLMGTLPSLPPEAYHPQELDVFLDQSHLVAPYHALLKAIEYRHTSANSSEASKSASDLNSENSKPIGIEATTNRAKVVLMSNAFSAEGKSSVVKHLAAVASMLGQRTLIIDADLRDGSQSHFFNLDQSYGLTDVILKKATIQEVCQKVNLENLSVLPIGTHTHRPSAIIESPLMKAVLEEAASHYDWIIVDATPMSTSSELITLSQIAGGVLLVLNSNSSRSKYDIKQVITDFQRSGGIVLGMVFSQEGLTKSEFKFHFFPNQKLMGLPIAIKLPDTHLTQL